MNDADFRRVRHTVRFTSDEDAKMRTIMANNGYRSVSIFIRDLLFKKQIVSRREVVRVTDRQMRNQMNDITYQIKKMVRIIIRLWPGTTPRQRCSILMEDHS